MNTFITIACCITLLLVGYKFGSMQADSYYKTELLKAKCVEHSKAKQ